MTTQTLIDILGAERFIDELEAAFSTDEWEEALEWIARTWEVDNEDETC